MIEEVAEKEVTLSDKALALVNEDMVVFMETLKDLVSELEPRLKVLTKEISPTVNAIRANLDKDETLLLVERLTANTGTMIEMVSYLEALNDLRRELEPRLKTLIKEASPTVNTIRANLDKDETLLLVERLTANTGTLIEMVSYLEALNDLRKELEPRLKTLIKEVSPTINAIRANLDKDETLLLVERLTANTGTMIEMVSYLEALNYFRKEMEPRVKVLFKEASPVLTQVRSFLENEKTLIFAGKAFTALQAFVEDEDTLLLLDRASGLKQPVAKFMDCVCTKGGDNGEEPAPVEYSLTALAKLTEVLSSPMLQNMLSATVSAIKDADETSIQPSSPLKLLSAMKDPDVQRASGFLIYFLKRLGQGLKAPH